MILPLIAVAALVGLAVLPAEAQTPFTGKGQVPTTPPPKAQPAQLPPPATTAPVQLHPGPTPGAAMPMSADKRQQAEFQAEGVFPDMTRPGAGGQVQDAWNDSDARKGVYVQRLCEDCVYKVRTREFMTTTVILPEDAVITSADPGDAVGFQVKVKSSNKLAVRPTAWGIDTNLNVYTRSGAVYPFYIRAETVNSLNVPDLVVRIAGRERPEAVAGIGEDHDKEKAKPDDGKPLAKGAKRDFVRHVPVDPAKFHGWGDYKLWGDESLKPETVWRDDFFTYIRYGGKWDGMELSAGYVTIDGIDELVNSHVEGSVFVVESTSPLITLKNGKKYLCIQYTGEKP
ncbi:TrbG/VirB9 family P-type conjugative transfer protein [Magnetospirillum sp. UT-4]|uniref:TrbG/VirB9 family P-type conjugative transfer protein n=1 Tax=Magnetospirillum sp. UT-4 TaxID=2681467 RepID=UPI001383D9E2|nr:TrbG/VirB9 family P-type conjugative transfer protein [Magnetospirillum sp. UT-4]CAA7619313.1 ComB2 protein [Magnetospirillum sp. UT-4]